MKVRDLKTNLESKTEKAKVDKFMTSISHWIKRIFESTGGQYATHDLGEISTLEKLAEMELLTLSKGAGDKIVAEITPSGKELYRDFTGHGFYL